MTIKNALILGCYGQDGSLLSKSLLEKGYKIFGITRSLIKNHKNHVSLGIENDIEIREGDITDSKTIRKLIEIQKPSTIYNLAAQSSVGQSFINPTNTIESIVNGSLNILEIARNIKFDGKIFFAGSSEIFGNTDEAADMNHKQCPNNPYGIGKQTSLNLVRLYRDIYNINCMTGILFNHESPLRNENFVTQKIISEAIKCTKNKSHTFKLGNIGIARDWGWAEEYVEAMQLITNSELVNDYVICTGKLTTLKDFAKTTFNLLNLNWENHIIIDERLFRKKDIKRSFGDPSRLSSDLNWKATIKVEKIIEKLIDAKNKKK